MSRLIAGLGNPGAKYAQTRHNIGFEVVKTFARRRGFSFKKGFRLKGEIAEGEVREEKCICLLPMAYMNRSGVPIRKALGRHHVRFSDPEAFLVVVDDVYLPFGAMRLRATGGDGGHNGLKNIEESLNSSSYARLRIGVGTKTDLTIPLEEYVLGEFSSDEKQKLPRILERGADTIDCWIDHGLEKAMQMAGEVKHERS